MPLEENDIVANGDWWASICWLITHKKNSEKTEQKEKEDAVNFRLLGSSLENLDVNL